MMVISIILSIFAEIFDIYLRKARLFMGSRDEKDKTKIRKEKLAGYFYNLSQLIFTGTGVGGVLPFLHGTASSGDISVLVFGAVATAVFAYAANRVLKY